jgi:hypothetical protein
VKLNGRILGKQWQLLLVRWLEMRKGGQQIIDMMTSVKWSWKKEIKSGSKCRIGRQGWILQNIKYKNNRIQNTVTECYKNKRREAKKICVGLTRAHELQVLEDKEKANK